MRVPGRPCGLGRKRRSSRGAGRAGNVAGETSSSPSSLVPAATNGCIRQGVLREGVVHAARSTVKTPSAVRRQV
jgi:hypothetical protein